MVGFLSDLSLIPHTTKDSLEFHHRQIKLDSQYWLVFDPAGQVTNRAAPQVDGMGLLRIGDDMLFVYNDAQALDKRRRYAA